MPFSTERDLFGAALWLERIAEQQRPTAIFIFHNPDFAWTVGEQRKKVGGDFFHMALCHKRGCAPCCRRKKLIIRATNPRLAEVLVHVFDYGCEKCAHPRLLYGERCPGRALEKSDPRVTVRLAGQFSGREKGAG